MGLKLFGRRATWQHVGRFQLIILHVIGAALGGAIVGGAIAVVGAATGLHGARQWVLAIAVCLALVVGLFFPNVKLGRQRQVPRNWALTMEPRRRFIFWGALLGSGVATLIPYSAFIVLIGAQLTVPIELGAFAGAIFGAMRQASTLLPLARGSEIEAMMESLTRLRSTAQGANIAVIVAGGAAILFS